MEVGKNRILLIDDEDFIRELYKRQLDLAGFQTDAFGLGEQGLVAVKDTVYDLILLDIMLPHMNGLDILKKIKADSRYKDVPVILLTNLGQDNIIKEAFALGAKDYVIKASYTPDQIVEKVRKVLSDSLSNEVSAGK